MSMDAEYSPCHWEAKTEFSGICIGIFGQGYIWYRIHWVFGTMSRVEQKLLKLSSRDTGTSTPCDKVQCILQIWLSIGRFWLIWKKKAVSWLNFGPLWDYWLNSQVWDVWDPETENCYRRPPTPRCQSAPSLESGLYGKNCWAKIY